MIGNVEFLEVGLEEGIRRLVCTYRSGEDLFSQFFQIDAGDTGKAFRHPFVPGSSRRGLEHDGVADDSGSHQPGKLRARHQSVLLVHGGDDRGCGADRFIPHEAGVPGLNVSEAVVIDDPNQLRLLDTGNSLAHLIVVHEDKTLAVRTQQVVAAERSDYMLVLIQDRVTAETALGDDVADIVQIIVQMESDKVRSVCYTAHRNGLVEHPGSTVCVAGCGDNAGLGGDAEICLGKVGLAENDTVDADLQGLFHHIRLLSADDDGFLFQTVNDISCCGKSNNDFTGDPVEDILIVVDDPSFQRSEKVEDRNVFHMGRGSGVHIRLRDASRGDHTIESSVFICDGRRVVSDLALKNIPGMAHRNFLSQERGLVILDVLYLGAYVRNEKGRLKTELLEQECALVVHVPESCGHISVFTQRVAQAGICHGGDDGVGVGVAVPAYQCSIHILTSVSL